MSTNTLILKKFRYKILMIYCTSIASWKGARPLVGSALISTYWKLIRKFIKSQLSDLKLSYCFNNWIRSRLVRKANLRNPSLRTKWLGRSRLRFTALIITRWINWKTIWFQRINKICERSTFGFMQWCVCNISILPWWLSLRDIKDRR